MFRILMFGLLQQLLAYGLRGSSQTSLVVTLNSNLFKFEEQAFMPDFMKRFRDVNKDSTKFLAIFKCFLDLVNKKHKLVNSNNNNL